MEFIELIISFILNIDDHLVVLFNDYGLWIYGILFLIVFCETGLIVTPFLPGDSLLFATGALIAMSVGQMVDPVSGQQLLNSDSPVMNVHLMAIVVIIAAILGDTVNYTIGRFFGKQLFRNPDSKIFRRDYLAKAEGFYEKHGGKTIVMCRFVPIVRTFAPFVAGMSKMNYRHFVIYNVVGAFLWVGIFLYLGYFFGNLPVVRKNFTLLIFGIIFVSILPIVWEGYKAHRASKRVPEV